MIYPGRFSYTSIDQTSLAGTATLTICPAAIPVALQLVHGRAVGKAVPLSARRSLHSPESAGAAAA